MNRLRVRVGETIKEYPYKDGILVDALSVEDAIDHVLDRDFHFGPYELTTLGEFAYDILVDDRKVGHAKAFDNKPVPPKPDTPTLWGWFLLIVSAYGALC